MEEKFCPFLWTFEINGLSLRCVFQHSNVGNTQQAGTRIHSCIPATGHRQNTRLNLNVTKETETNGIRSRMGQKPSLRFLSKNTELEHINNIELLALVLVPKNIAKFQRQSTSILEVHTNSNITQCTINIKHILW